MKKYVLMSLFIMFAIAGCAFNDKDKDILHDSPQKSVSRVDRIPNHPKDYKLLDFKTIAKKYDQLVFNSTLTGEMMPLLTWDKGSANTTLDKVPTLPSYVGTANQGAENSQEAINLIASYLSATLVGIDKSNDNGYNYIAAMDNFYNPKEKVVLNNPTTSSSGVSFWYKLLPSILYIQVSMLYEDEALIREHALETIESWYYAHRVMYGVDGKKANYAFNGFNFNTMSPHMNQGHKEPEAAVGIALIMDYGYELTNDEKYKKAAIEALTYIDQLGHSANYEAMQDFAPYLTAKYNALYGTSFNPQKMFSYLFDGASPYREKWGLIVGDFSDTVEGNGLYGSQNDAQGYAFAMNTFNMASAVLPTVKYDTAYANMVGKLLLNLISNSRYFFKHELPLENQSCTFFEPCKDFLGDPEGVIPYEGLRKAYSGRSPYASGDQSVYNWGGKTDFSLYSGSHTGRLASLYEPTDVEMILKLNLNATDFMHDSYPTYLIYNPYNEVKEVTYQVKSDRVDLFDLLTRTYLAKDVSQSSTINISGSGSRLVVEIPTNLELKSEGTTLTAGNKVVAYNTVTTVLTSHETNAVIKGDERFTFKLYAFEKNEAITNIEFVINNVVYEGTFSNNQLVLDVNQLPKGYMNVMIKVTTTNHIDYINTRFKVE